MKLPFSLLALLPLALATSSCDREASASAPKQQPPATPPGPPIKTTSTTPPDPDGGSSKTGVEVPPPDITASTPKPMPKRQPYQPETDEELRARLTETEYLVTKHEATERAYTGQYDKHYEEGIYVCVISGEPLFSSKDKYDSKCGWPAFTRPINESEVAEKTDYKIGYARTEVRAKTGDAHLGHVFPDGPPDQGGLRYCINSASLRFVPKDKLLEEGYGDYLASFESESDSGSE